MLEQIGPYRVVRLIGEGGMGAVYEGRHGQSGRRVAIKVLLPHLAVQREVVARFFNEAQAMAAIGHPAIVQVLEVERIFEGPTYMAMEFLEGETLTARIKLAGPMAEGALPIARTVADALVVAHQRGVVHRDLKPDNIMLARDPWGHEVVKVLDFGIAKIGESAELGAPVAAVKTKTGMVLGTPAYMSPEQIRGLGGITGKADVYSLGCVLYHMLAGRAPFAGGVGEIIAAQVYEQPASLSEVARGTPARLVELVGWMMRKAPEERPSMVEVRDALQALERGQTPTLVGLNAAAVATIVGGKAPIAAPAAASSGRGARIFLAAAAVLLVAVIATVVVVTLKRPSPEAPPPPLPTTTPAPPKTDGAKTAAARVFLVVKSDPPGADVVAADGTVLGKTPWLGEEDKRPGQNLALTLRRAGYADLPIAVDVGEDQKLTFTLKAKKKRGAGDSDEPAIVPLR